MTTNANQPGEPVALKPCPFCGGVAEMDWYQPFRHYRTGEPLDQPAIYCIECSAQIAHYPGDLDLCREETSELVIAAWNTRPAPVDGLVLPCDVHIPPATVIRAGVPFAALRMAMEVEGRPRSFAGNPVTALRNQSDAEVERAAIIRWLNALGDIWSAKQIALALEAGQHRKDEG